MTPVKQSKQFCTIVLATFSCFVSNVLSERVCPLFENVRIIISETHSFKTSNQYICVCVCVCERERESECVRVRVFVCVYIYIYI